MTKSTRQLMVSWHIGVTGKQRPDDPDERNLYDAEWNRQKRRLKRRQKPHA